MNSNAILAIAGALGIGSVGMSLYSLKRVNDSCNKLDLCMKDLKEKTVVDVEKAVVNKVIEKKVDEKVGDACKEAIEEVTDDIRKQVRREVDKTHDNVEAEVTEMVTKELANINMSDLEKNIERRANKYVEKNLDRIMDDAKNTARREFEGKLASVCSDYNRNLSNISTIYSSIADSLSGNKSGKEMTFKIG